MKLHGTRADDSAPDSHGLVVAHRGVARGDENTIAAFDRALDAGADVIELDVRRARDGSLVVAHDAMSPIWRWVKAPVQLLAPDQVQAPDGSVAPSLEDVVAWARSRGARLQVELKDRNIADDALRQLAPLDVDRYAISSFHEADVRRVEQERPDVETVLWRRGSRWKPFDVDAAVQAVERSQADSLGAAGFSVAPLPVKRLLAAAEAAHIDLYVGGAGGGAARGATLLEHPRVRGVITDHTGRLVAARDDRRA